MVSAIECLSMSDVVFHLHLHLYFILGSHHLHVLVHFGAAENPIEMMKHEHENEGDRFEKIAQLLNQYTPPSDACNTRQVTYKMLQEFEENLHTHIHLENNI